VVKEMTSAIRQFIRLISQHSRIACKRVEQAERARITCQHHESAISNIPTRQPRDTHTHTRTVSAGCASLSDTYCLSGTLPLGAKRNLLATRRDRS
jgi:hypothetical protein